jgi:hypothetical protein
MFQRFQDGAMLFESDSKIFQVLVILLMLRRKEFSLLIFLLII